ncbi:oligosaccharide flippase family protein [Salarchaeum sp. JOR-1]|uniref:oligosaccharide flippase family protein n=1 Tax=Salarchaeum sp. JOR-1 TaxID=2599399 RepID=UPI0011984DA7|nr:oligosaccharide flippase family protein [Salarchaeum sp. JOR-1]QDX41031.1 polysaccharide biosynthesis protein [Salarchaeum sp. JOR-1]
MGIARSGIAYTGAKTFSLLASFLAVIYFTRTLDQATVVLGKYYMFETVVSFLTLIGGAGLSGALTKRMSEGEERSAYFSSAVLGSIMLLSGASAVVLLFRSDLAELIGFSEQVLVFIVIYLWARQGRYVADGVLQGEGRVGWAGVMEFIDIGVRTSVQVTLIATGHTLFGLIIGAVVGASGAAIVAFWISHTSLGSPSIRHLEHLVSFAKYAVINSFAGKFYDNIDRLVIWFVLGSSAVGIYTVAFRFALPFIVFINGMTAASFPQISRNMVKENTDRVRTILSESIALSTVFSIPAAVAMSFLAYPIIVTLYTPELAAGASVALIAVIIKIPEGYRWILTATADGLDRPDLSTYTGIILVFTNGILDLILVPTFGIIGAAIASLVAMCASVLYIATVLSDILELSVEKIPLRSILDQCLAASGMGASVWILYTSIDIDSTLSLFVLIAAGALWYFVILLTISTPMRRRLIGIAGDIVPIRPS